MQVIRWGEPAAGGAARLVMPAVVVQIAVGWTLVTHGVSLPWYAVSGALLAVFMSSTLLWIARGPMVVRAIGAGLLVMLLLALAATSAMVRGSLEAPDRPAPPVMPKPAMRAAGIATPIADTAAQLAAAVHRIGGNPGARYTIESEIVTMAAPPVPAVRIIWYVRGGEARTRCGDLTLSAQDEAMILAAASAAFDRAIDRSVRAGQPLCR